MADGLDLKKLKEYLDAQKRGEAPVEQLGKYKNTEPGLGTMEDGVEYASDLDARFKDGAIAAGLGTREQFDEMDKQQVLGGGWGEYMAAAPVMKVGAAPSSFDKIRKLLKSAPEGVIKAPNEAALMKARAGLTRPGTITEAKVIRSPSTNALNRARAGMEEVGTVNQQAAQQGLANELFSKDQVDSPELEKLKALFSKQQR